MEKLEKIIQETFKSKIFDNNSKKEFKKYAKKQGLEKSDLNFCIKLAFDLYKKSPESGSDSFLIDWLQDIVNAVNDLKSDIYKVVDVKFSPIHNCSARVIDFIKSAKESLLICVFTISDNDISREILKKYRQGVKVQVISDDQKQFDMGSDIQELANASIPVKVDESRHHMHHKFAIVDGKYLLTGSYNWTRSATEYNQENIIILKDEFAVKSYLNEFQRLWKITVAL